MEWSAESTPALHTTLPGMATSKPMEMPGLAESKSQGRREMAQIVKGFSNPCTYLLTEGRSLPALTFEQNL